MPRAGSPAGKEKRRAVLAAAVLFLCCAGALFCSLVLACRTGGLSAGTYPLILSALLTVAALILLIRVLRQPCAAPAADAETAGPAKSLIPLYVLLFILLALLAVGVRLILLIPCFLFICGHVLYHRRWWTSLLFAGAVTLLCYAVFELAFGIRLP